MDISVSAGASCLSAFSGFLANIKYTLHNRNRASAPPNCKKNTSYASIPLAKGFIATQREMTSPLGATKKYSNYSGTPDLTIN